jgi:hypothetical protein
LQGTENLTRETDEQGMKKRRRRRAKMRRMMKCLSWIAAWR